MSELELTKLSRFAGSICYTETGKYTAQGLLQDTLISFLDGSRKWDMDKIPFFVAFWGAMKSTSSNWAKHISTSNGDIELKLIQAEQGENNDLDLYLATTNVDCERYVDSKLKVEMVQEHFKSDPDVANLIDAMLNDFTGPEIKELYSWSQNKLETTKRRFDRGILKIKGRLEHD